MKITKFGHCCLLVEVDEVRILIDPGTYSTGQNDLSNIDLILITHEHQDHLHIDSLKTVLKNNPQATVGTNKSVGLMLEKEGIAFEIIEDGQTFFKKEVLVEGVGKEHAVIYETLPTMQNTGYFIAQRFFYPGDSFSDPGKEVGILALPVAGPWLKLSDAIEYAIRVKPKFCFPVHEGILKSPGSAHRVPQEILSQQGIRFEVLELGKTYEF